MQRGGALGREGASWAEQRSAMVVAEVGDAAPAINSSGDLCGEAWKIARRKGREVQRVKEKREEKEEKEGKEGEEEEIQEEVGEEREEPGLEEERR
ncbi:hypothetical protein M0R45_035869 [Rubus argutus]|uniref:Uncharacterized protein n=1 Tax=Rubus argutus TaxID=59490 RepID=A0AAW1VYN8_RUBAR